jgi:hypothetical protein
MKYIYPFSILLLFSSTVATAGMSVTCDVNGSPNEGYNASPGPNAPLVMLVHDWDGLADYHGLPLFTDMRRHLGIPVAGQVHKREAAVDREKIDQLGAPRRGTGFDQPLAVDQGVDQG